MSRILLCLVALASLSVFASEPTLPKSVPPFALGSFCVASVVDQNGKTAVSFDMYRLRSRHVETDDRLPVDLDGKMLEPDRLVRDTFSPTRQRSISVSLDDVSVWDRDGKRINPETLATLLTEKKRAVILNRDVVDADIGYLQYFADDVVFIRLSALIEGLLKQRRG